MATPAETALSRQHPLAKALPEQALVRGPLFLLLPAPLSCRARFSLSQILGRHAHVGDLGPVSPVSR